MSTLNVDALVGNTSANAITVRGEGSATTSLQQGLGKVWCDLDGTGTIALDDSLNCASATDNNTGNYTIAYTTNMGNANYSLTGTGMGRAVVIITSRAAGNTNVYTQDHNDGTNEKDSDPVCLQIMGDLA
jgi:hypothetical protein